MSLQLDQYLQARADGATVEDACELSTIGLGEALLETYLNAIGMTPIEHAIAMAA